MDWDKVNRRQFIQYSLLAAGYSLTAGSALLAPLVHAIGKVPKQMDDDESIFTLSGSVIVDGKKANEKTIVKPNAEIVTQSNSQLIFVVGKDAHILRENSQVVLTHNSSTLETGLQLAKGKMLSVFGKRKESEASLKVKTSTATIGIRGTGVYSESFPDHSYVCTCYGQTAIASSMDPTSQEVVTTTHHDSPRYILKDGKKGKLIETAPVKNHSDEELMLVEALVGRAPPFSSILQYNSPRRGY